MNANELINSYFKYLENNTAIIDHENGWSEIILPFMDNQRDFLDLFIKSFSGGNPLASAGGRSRFLLS